MGATGFRPEWAHWATDPDRAPWTIGIEEEVMLLEPGNWALAQSSGEVLPALGEKLSARSSAETHGAALELATRPHESVSAAMAELGDLRTRLSRAIAGLGLRAAVSGTHPFAIWRDTRISSGERYQEVYGTMRELARREPTFALHVHVGVPEAEVAVRLANRLRAHLPLLLALSANSPFWQGRDSGLASVRTPLFQAFPRVGIPRAFDSYAEYVEAVDLLIRCRAFPEPTFLWWDVRLQPRFATVEVRVMDAQTRLVDTAALAALVQAIARLEVRQGFVSPELVAAPEVLEENRFLAARDGMDADLIDPVRERRIAARRVLDRLLDACRPHAEALGSTAELDHAAELGKQSGGARQLDLARGPEHLPGLVGRLAEEFLAGVTSAPPPAPAPAPAPAPDEPEPDPASA